jgi:tetratricopeptide (TPR) repeat protein
MADARGRYEAILALDPSAAVAANNLAWIYAAEERDLDRALRLAQTATRLMPDSAQAHDTLGWIYYRMELPALGIPALERSVALDPSSAEHFYHLGFAYAKGGDETKARAALERALKMQPQGSDADTARNLLPSLRP